LPTPQTTAANNSFFIFTPLSVLVHCIPPLSRFARRAGFVALRQTFVRRSIADGDAARLAGGAICGAGAVARNCRRGPQLTEEKGPGRWSWGASQAGA